MKLKLNKSMLAKCKTKRRLGGLFENDLVDGWNKKKCSMIWREDMCRNSNGACCKTQRHVLI